MKQLLERTTISVGGTFAPGLAPHAAEIARSESVMQKHNPEMHRSGVRINELLTEWDGKSIRRTDENLAFLNKGFRIFQEALSNQHDKGFYYVTSAKPRKS